MSNKLFKTAQPLDEDLFWSIIEESLIKTNTQDEQEQYLIRRIEQLTPEEMVGFRLKTDKFLRDTYNSPMWCAGYIMNGGCSDDGFEYFRNWVISRGKEVYNKAKENPDSLISEAMVDMYEFEGFWYVALEAFKNKTGEKLYDYIDYENINEGERNYPHFEFTWQEEDSESRKKICPQLFSAFEGE